MRRILNRILGRRTAAAPAPAEPSPYAPVWTTGTLPESPSDPEPRRPSTIADDEAVLRMLAGANFGPNGVILPTGRHIDGDEAQALTAFYAPAAEEDR